MQQIQATQFERLAPREAKKMSSSWMARKELTFFFFLREEKRKEHADRNDPVEKGN